MVNAGPQPGDASSKSPTEHAHQVDVFVWAALNAVRWPELRMMFAIPNGGERNIIVASRLKAEGVKKDVPDIFLPAPRGPWHGLFIEMKKPGKHHVQPGQNECIAKLQALGYGACVCVGWQEAVKVLENYLSYVDVFA